MDLMSDMYLASLLQKGRMLDPQAMPAERMLEMATINGARCLGLDGEIGSLEPGKKADLIVLAADDVGVLPMHDPVANLVYAMRSGNVVSSMVDGRWIMRDRVILGVDESAVLQEARIRAASLLERSGIALKPRFPIPERQWRDEP
jgi:5-methylthioadenosine/S-adenosylhomocysteine deaminase